MLGLWNPSEAVGLPRQGSWTRQSCPHLTVPRPREAPPASREFPFIHRCVDVPHVQHECRPIAHVAIISDAYPVQRAEHAEGRLAAWAVRHNLLLTVAAASVSPILYLLFINKYATNAFYADDWSVPLLVHAVIHGHLSLSQLWSQYNESRLFVGNIVFVLFGLVDRFDVRSVIFFNAVVLIASYVFLLGLVRHYLHTRLKPVPVLVIGLIWFSLADVQNALWAFQTSWYLTVLFLVVMLFAFLVPDRWSLLWFAAAVLAAVAGSLTTLQGLIFWPLGMVCILWLTPWSRRTLIKSGLWVGIAAATIVSYFSGYSFDENACLPSSSCSLRIALHHPVEALR